MKDWVDPPEYNSKVEEFLAPLRGTVFWDGMWYACTDIQRFKAHLDILNPYANVEGKRVLDSGCGTAGLSIASWLAGASEVVGIELDEKLSAVASHRVKQIPRIQIINDDAGILKLAPSSFDIIFSIHVIEHVSDPRSYLQTQADLLKSGGFLLIACPNWLWPREAHSGLAFIHYLPRPLAKALGRWIESAKVLPRDLRDRGRTSTLYETNFNYLGFQRMLRACDLQVLEMNHPRYSMAGRVVRRFPFRFQRLVTAIYATQLIAVCRKR